jgi:hypothetical protein
MEIFRDAGIADEGYGKGTAAQNVQAAWARPTPITSRRALRDPDHRRRGSDEYHNQYRAPDAGLRSFHRACAAERTALPMVSATNEEWRSVA